MKEPTPIKVCIVCALLVEHGEYNDGTDAAEKCQEGREKIWGDNASQMCRSGCYEDCLFIDDEDHECEDFEQGFSWSDCEGCGDPLGGDRFLFVVFE